MSEEVKHKVKPQEESYSFETKGEKIDVEKEVKNIATSFDPYKLTQALMLLGQKMYGLDLYAYQYAPSFRIIYSMLVNDGSDITLHFARQCIAKGQIIYDRNGHILPIELHKDSWKTGDNRKIYSTKGLRGYETFTTDNHPFFTPDGWKEQKDIRVGDKIAVLKRDVRFGDNVVPFKYTKYINAYSPPEVKEGSRHMDLELSELLGWLTADGSVKKGQSIKFTNTNKDYLDRVQFLVEKNFPDITTKTYPKGNAYDLLFTTGKKDRFNTLKDWVQEMAFVEGFPTAVNYLDKDNLSSFFRGMYPADGYVCIKNNRGGSGTQEYECGLSCGNSYLLAQYVREFLNKLGIRGRIKTEVMKKHTPGETFKRVVFTGNTNAIIFRDTIGCILGKKNPPVYRELSSIKRRKIVDEIIGDDGEVMEFVRVISTGYSHDGEVWDIRVPDKGWFLANGIKVHNSGKSEVVSFVSITVGVFFPVLAKVFTKDLGHFKNGVKMGIIAPQLDQVETVYSRCLERLWQDSTIEFMSDSDINDSPTSIRDFRLKSGSFLKAQSGAKQSKIESKTYHIVFLDEAQDLDDRKIRKSVRPMLASTFGTMVRIGTSTYTMNDFYRRIVANKIYDAKLRSTVDKETKKLHYSYDADQVIRAKRDQYKKDGVRFHMLYEKSVEQDKRDMGENSDEFRLSYRLHWLFSTGMFTSLDNLTEYCYRKIPVISKIKGTEFENTFNIAGLDIAKAAASTVLTLGNVKEPVTEFGERGLKRVFGWLEFPGLDYALQLQYIINALVEYRVRVLFMDYTGVGVALGDLIMYHLSEHINIIPYPFSSKSKSEMWKTLDEDMEARLVAIPHDKKTVDTIEFRNFEEQMLALSKGWNGGYMVCEKTSGFKDDYCDSLALFNLAGNFIYEETVQARVDKSPFYASVKSYSKSSW